MLKKRLEQLIFSPDSGVVITVIGLLLVLPSLWVGLFADDFSHYVLLNMDTGLLQPDVPSFFHLFSFVDDNPLRREQLLSLSLIPWWTAPEFSMTFFRPLSELSHVVDYKLLTDYPWLMHLHSMFWYLLLLLLLQRVYGQVFQNRKLQLLSLLFFVVDATHGFTLAWLANRSAIMAACFSLLSLSAFIIFDKEKNFAYLLASTFCIVLAFSCGEIGISSGILLFAYVVFLSEQSIKERCFSLLPAFLVFIAWALFYQYHGYGAVGNKAYYADILAEPLYFFENFLLRFPVAISMLFNLLPLHFNPALQNITVSFGVLLFVVITAYCMKRSKAELWFSYCIVVLCIVPVASAEMQERNLLFASFFSAVILADVLLLSFDYYDMKRARVVAALLVGFHLLFSALLLLPMSYAPKLLAGNVLQQVQSTVNKKHLISFGLPLFDASFFVPASLYVNQQRPESFVNVTTAKSFRVERLSEARYQLDVEGGVFSNVDEILRDVQIDPIQEGEHYLLADVGLTVQQLNRQGLVSSVIIDVPVNSDYELITWQKNQAREIQLKVGGVYQQ